MGALLELFAGILVLVRRAQDRHDFLLGRKRDRAGHLGAGAASGLDDALGSLVNEAVLVSPELDANFLAGHFFSSLFVLKYDLLGFCPA